MYCMHAKKSSFDTYVFIVVTVFELFDGHVGLGGLILRFVHYAVSSTQVTSHQSAEFG